MQVKELSLLSQKELSRIGIIEQVKNKHLSQKEAGFCLGLSDRQIRRIMTKYKLSPGSIAHGNRGKPSKRRVDPRLLTKALDLIDTKYPDFGPTLASEKLQQLDNITINHETLRQAMIVAGLWRAKKQKARHRERRQRKPCYGEMAQFDGCRHKWLEGRGGHDMMTLLASRDDANNIVRAQFVDYEGTVPVMKFWKDYFMSYGKPASIYLDRHSTYKVNAKSVMDNLVYSQFERAMHELDVRVIHANTPQAKGRIENLFSTLQDRLVKELRLANIASIDDANTFLQTVFLPTFNNRFSVEPASSVNLHRPLNKKADLNRILSIQAARHVNRDFTVRFGAKWFQLAKIQPTLVLPKQKVIIEQRLDNSLHIRLNDHYLKYEELSTKPAKPLKPVTALASGINTKARVPAANHPWKKFQIKTDPVLGTKPRYYSVPQPTKV